MTRIVAYQVQQDGNWDPVTFKKADLKVKQVYIIVNDERKELWIWIGDGADVRTRFISSTAAAEIRRIYGLTLRVRTADQGSEPEDFWKSIELIPKEGLGPEIGREDLKSSKTTLKAPSLPKMVKRIPKIQAARKETIQKNTIRNQTSISPPEELKNGPLTTTPPCPQCKKGYLLPYSNIVKVSARKKEVLQFAAWICSNCNFSPKKPDLTD
ncbi:MAG: hypothetical protein ACFFAU_07170 [Candidatus Hodarchaeota archaeon]